MLELLLDQIFLDVLLLPLKHQLYLSVNWLWYQMLAAAETDHAAIGFNLTSIVVVILRHAIIVGLGDEIKAFRL